MRRIVAIKHYAIYKPLGTIACVTVLIHLRPATSLTSFREGVSDLSARNLPANCILSHYMGSQSVIYKYKTRLIM